MKKILLLSLLLVSLTGLAQTRYYQTTQTIQGDGYAYQCDVKLKFVSLYNAANKWTYEDIRYKDTGKTPNFDDIDPVMEDDNWTKETCHKIVDDAFSYEEASRVQNTKSMTISMYINSTTGKVEEVLFEFTTIGAYATIPVSVYRQIEVNLKKQVWFTPTQSGRRLTYILLWWGAAPSLLKDGPLQSLFPPLKPIDVDSFKLRPNVPEDSTTAKPLKPDSIIFPPITIHP
jgi:hypothetical protein